MKNSRRLKVVRVFCLIAIICLLAVRLFREFVPGGATVLPFWLASDNGPELTSPSGARVVYVFFNDAGALHSGGHWTWVVEDHWFFGPRVVAEDELSRSIRNGDEPVPLSWDEDEEPFLNIPPKR